MVVPPASLALSKVEGILMSFELTTTIRRIMILQIKPEISHQSVVIPISVREIFLGPTSSILQGKIKINYTQGSYANITISKIEYRKVFER